MESNLVGDYKKRGNTNNFATLVKEGTTATSGRQEHSSKQLKKIIEGLGE